MQLNNPNRDVALLKGGSPFADQAVKIKFIIDSLKHVGTVIRRAVSDDFGEDFIFGASRDGVIVAFDYDHARAFAEDEAVS